MPTPNSFRQNIREKARKAVNRKFERDAITDADLDDAVSEFTTDSYNEFFSDCRESGHPTERCGALWNRLKERGDVPTGGDGDGGSGATDSGPSDQMTTTEPPTPDPGAPEPETIDELEEALVDCDQVYLITQPGCPACQQAKEVLADWIDEGLVSVEDVQESDLGADIVVENDIGALPAMVMETDGERVTI